MSKRKTVSRPRKSTTNDRESFQPNSAVGAAGPSDRFPAPGFIDHLESDPWLALRQICWTYLYASTSTAQHRYHLESLAFLQAFLEEHGLNVGAEFKPGTGHTLDEDVKKFFQGIYTGCQEQFLSASIREAKTHFAKHFAGRVGTTLSAADIDEVRGLIAALRERISAFPELDKVQRRRLLKRLDELEQDLNVKIANVDGVYGLYAETQALLIKIGERFKPIADISKKMAELFYDRQVEAVVGHQLPDRSLPRLSLPHHVVENAGDHAEEHANPPRADVGQADNGDSQC